MYQPGPWEEMDDVQIRIIGGELNKGTFYQGWEGKPQEIASAVPRRHEGVVRCGPVLWVGVGKGGASPSSPPAVGAVSLGRGCGRGRPL